MGVLVFLSGSSPEMVRSLRYHRSLRPKGPGHSGPMFFVAQCSPCGAVLDWGPEVPRRWSGVSGPPESPAKGSGISGPELFLCSLPSCGVALDSSPEGHRKVTGVSGLIGVSGPSRPESPVCPDDPKCGAPRMPCPEEDRSWGGVSGLHRSLRPTYTGVSGLGRVQRLVFVGTYKRPPSSPNP